MAQAGLSISLSVKEIYDRLCPKCKKAIKDLIKEKITEELVEKALG
ncbi:MAG: hypothetical protein QXH20_07095 [Candidatus Bathyarchaeia archaeon]